MVNFKRLSALILALALVLGLATTALAEEAAAENGAEEAAVAEEVVEEAVEVAYVEIVPIAAEEAVAIPVILADLIAHMHDVPAGTVVTVPEPLVRDFAGDVTVSEPDAFNMTNEILAQTREQGALVAVANWINPTSVSLAVMTAMANTAGDQPMIINADTIPALSTAVDVRVTFAPALATKDINLAGSTRSVNTRVVRQVFENAFGGTASVVSLAQRGEFGMEVRVAAKFDESFTAANTYFYSYDIEANTITQFTPRFVWLDSYGYLHFTTTVGGEIVVSDVNLAAGARAPAAADAPTVVVEVAEAEEVEEEDEDEDEDEEEEAAA